MKSWKDFVIGTLLTTTGFFFVRMYLKFDQLEDRVMTLSQTITVLEARFDTFTKLTKRGE